MDFSLMWCCPRVAKLQDSTVRCMTIRVNLAEQVICQFFNFNSESEKLAMLASVLRPWGPRCSKIMLDMLLMPLAVVFGVLCVTW